MKPLEWILVLLALIILGLWWRDGDVRSEVSRLRTEIEVTRAAQGNHPADARVATERAHDDVPRARAGIPRQEGGDIASEQIAELQSIVTAQADHIDKLTARVEAADAQRQRAAARSWGPEQATGAPDTNNSGDHPTAWAPAQPDGGVEWLEATIEKPAEVAHNIVRQSSNPGTITKVVSMTETGAEIPIWSGQDPSKGQALADTPFQFPPGITTGRVRVYLDTSMLAGWEEVDALQLVGRDGSRQWAKSVNASSTYAGGRSGLNAFNLEMLGGGRTLIEANP